MPGYEFSGFNFEFQLLTDRHLIEPGRLTAFPMEEGIELHSECLLFGDGTRPAAGSLKIQLRNPSSGTVSWQVEATTDRPIKGIRVLIDSIEATALILPKGGRHDLTQEPRFGMVFPAGYYPIRQSSKSGIPGPNLPWWYTQFLLLESPNGASVLSSQDFPPRFQRCWLFRHQDRTSLAVYSEANASERITHYTTPRWTLEKTKDWHEPASRHRSWLEQAYNLKPISEREDTPQWVRDLNMNITFHAIATDDRIGITFPEMEERLIACARYCDPKRTHVHMVGWDGRWDYTWPALRPADELGGPEGFHRFMQTAHRYGYHVGPHMNCMGLSYDNPEYEQLKHFQEEQVCDSEGRPLSWATDWDGDEVDEDQFAYISPDYKPWRDYLITRILQCVQEYDLDVAHLDQTNTLINDRKHNHWRGLGALFTELRQKLPADCCLSGEETCEPVMNLYPLTGLHPSDHGQLYQFLFSPYLRQFAYGYTPENRRSLHPSPWPWFPRHWSKDWFYQYLELTEQCGCVPTLLLSDREISVESPEAAAVFTAARRFQPFTG